MKGKVVPVNAMKAYKWSGGIAPLILSFGSRWKWMVSLMLQPLYAWGRSTCYCLNGRLGGPQSQCRYF